MDLLNDVHQAEIAGHEVVVRGKTGPIHATWQLLIDGEEVEQATATGEFTLSGRMPDGSVVDAVVLQRIMGPTKVVIRHDGEDVARSKGYVA
jgi:hypothetical protein